MILLLQTLQNNFIMTTTTIQWDQRELEFSSIMIPAIKKAWEHDKEKQEHLISDHLMRVYLATFEPNVYKKLMNQFSPQRLGGCRRIWKKKEKEFLPLILQAVEEFTGN